MRVGLGLSRLLLFSSLTCVNIFCSCCFPVFSLNLVCNCCFFFFRELLREALDVAWQTILEFMSGWIQKLDLGFARYQVVIVVRGKV